MDQLIQKLGQFNPAICTRPEKTAAALQECIRRNYVHVLFTGTGTELGFQLYRPQCDLSGQAGTARVLQLVGGLTLNYVKVKCIAQINADTCEGEARLEPVTDPEYQQLLGD
jgi:hypothetical protein